MHSSHSSCCPVINPSTFCIFSCLIQRTIALFIGVIYRQIREYLKRFRHPRCRMGHCSPLHANLLGSVKVAAKIQVKYSPGIVNHQSLSTGPPKIQTAGVHNKYLGVNLSWWQKTHSKLDGIDRFGRTSICVLLGLVKWLFMGVLWSIYDFTHGLAPCITIVMLCLWTTERSRSPFYGPDNGVDCLANHHRIAIAIASICYMPHLISSKHG